MGNIMDKPDHASGEMCTIMFSAEAPLLQISRELFLERTPPFKADGLLMGSNLEGLS